MIDTGDPIVMDISERDIDFLLLEEIGCHAAFRAWFLGRVGASPGASTDVLRLRRSVATFRGETDLLLIHKDADGRRRAVMIENKVAAAFTELQPQRYRARGEDGVENGEWEYFVTVLVAPRDRLAGVASDAFDYQLSYEELVEEIHGVGPRALFKRNVLVAACGLARSPWVQVVNPSTTAWFMQARAFAVSAYPDLPLPLEGQGRAASNTWMTFTPYGYPRSRVCIEIKPAMGVVDLRLKGVSIGDLRRALGDQLPVGAGTDVAPSAKSCSVRMTHAAADVRAPFAGQEEVVRPLFESAFLLMKFAEDRTAIINGMLAS